MMALIAFLLGGLCVWAFQRWRVNAMNVAERATDRLSPGAPIAAIRWEQTGVDLTDGVLRHLRRHRPTHDLLTNIPFLEIVKPKGNAAAMVSRRCADWMLPIVLVDRRIGRLDRVVLMKGDPDLMEKQGILKRTSIRTMIVSADAGDDEVATALAA